MSSRPNRSTGFLAMEPSVVPSHNAIPLDPLRQRHGTLCWAEPYWNGTDDRGRVQPRCQSRLGTWHSLP